MNREEVYKAIDTEREYQEFRWGAEGQEHSFEEWFMYIEDYVAEAKHKLSRLSRELADEQGSEIVRKVGALAVAAMEQHGVNPRNVEGLQ